MPQASSNPSRFRAWLELMRISNLPTVWTNVFVGFAIDRWPGNVGAIERGWRIEVWEVVALCIAMSLIYIGGMAMNDVLDQDVDKLERPHRPIPSGRVSPFAAQRFVQICFILGVVITWWVRPTSTVLAGILVGTIALYNLLHKKHAWSVLLMGLCRGLLILMAPTRSEADPQRIGLLLIALPLAITLYTAGITIISRGETKDTIGPRKWLSLLMPVVVFIAPLLVLQPRGVSNTTGFPALVMLVWMTVPIIALLRSPPKPVKAILAWLSGMCLIDAYWLVLLGQNEFAMVAAGCFVLTVAGHRKILGT
ncbi:MAG: UbiA family prenyltransferase [Phycisphaeraceae bacterium]